MYRIERSARHLFSYYFYTRSVLFLRVYSNSQLDVVARSKAGGRSRKEREARHIVSLALSFASQQGPLVNTNTK